MSLTAATIIGSAVFIGVAIVNFLFAVRKLYKDKLRLTYPSLGEGPHRFKVILARDGSFHGYGVEDILVHTFLLPMRFNMTYNEAVQWCEDINRERGWKLSFIDRYLLFISQEDVDKAKAGTL